MRVRIKGYYDVATFELAPVKSAGKRKCEYIRFRSKENVKRLFDFYKNEMQQGEKPGGCNLGRSRIAETGFFNYGYKHWNEFLTYIPRIIYRAELINDQVVEISPVQEGKEAIDDNIILDV